MTTRDASAHGRRLAAIASAAALAIGSTATAAPVQCPRSADPLDREFIVTTAAPSTCIAWGLGNINGNADAVNLLGLVTLDKSDAPGDGLAGFDMFISGVGATGGAFAFAPPAGYTDFVLGLKTGGGQVGPTWTAFRLGSTAGTWSVSGSQALSHANLYGRFTDGLASGPATVPEPGGDFPLAAAPLALTIARRGASPGGRSAAGAGR